MSSLQPNMSLFNSIDPASYNNFCLHWTLHWNFCICDRFFASCMIFSLSFSKEVFPFLKLINCVAWFFRLAENVFMFAFVSIKWTGWIKNNPRLYISLFLVRLLDRFHMMIIFQANILCLQRRKMEYSQIYVSE